MRHILLKKALAVGSFAPYPVFSLVLFFIVFTGVLVWLFRPRAAQKYRDISRSILRD